RHTRSPRDCSSDVCSSDLIRRYIFRFIFQVGYGDEPEDVAANVRLGIETAIAGLSIEDGTGRSDRLLYEKKLAVERIRAARTSKIGRASCREGAESLVWRG